MTSAVDRRAIITVAATQAVATAMDLAVALPAAVDPIHQLVAHHVEACRLADAAREDCDRNLIDGRTYEEQALLADKAFLAFMAELHAARALDGSATTPAGLQALEDHRQVVRHRRFDVPETT
jgi:hypothetical protein